MRLFALLLALTLPAAAQQIPLSPPAARPCPALLARIDGWITQLGQPIDSTRRRALHARLRAAGRPAAARMAASLEPAHARQQQALARRDPAASHLLVAVLDLLQLLGESGAPEAYPALDRAARQTAWTDTLRKRALLALGRLGDPRGLTLLAGLFADQELGYTAGRALLSIERFESVTHWIDLLDSQSQDLKVDAHEALKKWSGERIGPERKEWRRFFRQYPEGFKKLPGYREAD